MKPGVDYFNVLSIGSGEIATAMAEAFPAAEGNKVLVTNRTEAKNAKAVDALRKLGVDAQGAVLADASSREQLLALRANLPESMRPLTTLIISAGGNRSPVFGPGTEIDDEKAMAVFDDVVNTNFRLTAFAAQIFGQLMVEQPDVPASIIVLGSETGIVPWTRVIYYSAAKAAAHSIAKSLAVHFPLAGAKHIRVNMIIPGVVDTPQNHDLLFNPGNSPTPRCARILDHTPMGRLAVPSDFIGPTRFLADPKQSGFITALPMFVDGGMSAYMI